MKVKIGDAVYDSEEEPIMLILSPEERLHIHALPPHARQFVRFPDGADIRLIMQWMAEVPGFAMDAEGEG